MADPKPGDYDADWSEPDVAAIAREARRLGSAQDSLEAFSLFSDIEQRMEPIEKETRAAAAYVGERIQFEIDRMRGK